jgi:DNA invertase Pin-like site-specific DNA recombinase
MREPEMPALLPIRTVGLYSRVSTGDQSPANQLAPLRTYAEARGWKAVEYVDHGVSGARERRPALDAMLTAARARRIDAVVCTKLDRLARSTRHLVAMAAELEALGVHLVVVDQAIDTTTPTGRLLFTVLAAISEFERDLIRERVAAGIRRAKASGIRIGRPRKHDVDPDEVAGLRASGLSLSEIGRRLGNGTPIDPTVIRRALQRAAAGARP